LERSVGFPEIDERINYKNEEMKVTKTDFYNEKIYLLNNDRQTFVLTLEEFKKLK
jgi:hypothetical protein